MIIFRTDASTKTGGGHLRRSAYLASFLRKKTEIRFCLGSVNDKAVTRYLEEKKWSFISLKQFNQEENLPVKGIIFDLRYFTDEDLQLLRRAKAGHWATLQITDLGQARQETDYTIDASPEPLLPYPEGKPVLRGPDYAILHTKYRHFNRVRRKYRKEIRQVFVSLGSGVEYRHLRKFIDGLSRQGLKIKIAPGFYMKKAGPKILRRLYPGIRFVGETESLARSFFEADAALVAAGASAFEAAAVGTPALYFYGSDEQRFAAQSFEKQGVGLEISATADLSHVNLVDRMKELTLEKRIEMGNKGKQLVDARGIYRVMDFLERQHFIAFGDQKPH